MIRMDNGRCELLSFVSRWKPHTGDVRMYMYVLTSPVRHRPALHTCTAASRCALLQHARRHAEPSSVEAAERLSRPRWLSVPHHRCYLLLGGIKVSVIYVPGRQCCCIAMVKFHLNLQPLCFWQNTPILATLYNVRPCHLIQSGILPLVLVVGQAAAAITVHPYVLTV